MDLPTLDISYKWNHVLCGFLCLAALARLLSWRSMCIMYRRFIPICVCPIGHMDNPHLGKVQIYLVSSPFSCNWYPNSPGPTLSLSVFSATISLSYVCAWDCRSKVLLPLKICWLGKYVCVGLLVKFFTDVFGYPLDFWIQLDETRSYPVKLQSYLYWKIFRQKSDLKKKKI